MKIKIAGMAPNSLVNGEGIRFTVFFNGCRRDCPGCHNKELQDFDNPNAVLMDTDDIVAAVKKEEFLIDGVTLSGGDPLYQPEGLVELCEKLKNFNIWLYTGETYENIPEKLLENIDVVVDGMFIEELKDENIKYRGSSNQRIIKKA